MTTTRRTRCEAPHRDNFTRHTAGKPRNDSKSSTTPDGPTATAVSEQALRCTTDATVTRDVTVRITPGEVVTHVVQDR